MYVSVFFLIATFTIQLVLSKTFGSNFEVNGRSHSSRDHHLKKNNFEKYEENANNLNGMFNNDFTFSECQKNPTL